MFRLLAVLLLAWSAHAATTPWLESNFPFFSSVLDARKHEPNNLTPRALILNVASNTWVAFDTDLLRVAAIWQGPGVTPVSMAQTSHYTPGKKAPEGQNELPEIIGEPLLLNGLYSGVQATGEPVFQDIRPPGPDPREIGRGPLPNTQFKAIQLRPDGIHLEYEVSGIPIDESYSVSNSTLKRTFKIAARNLPVTLLVDRFAGIEMSPSTTPTEHVFPLKLPQPVEAATNLLAPRWSQTIATAIERASTNDVFRIEHIALPIENPWMRAVRLADISFFPDGRAAGVTFDGDIWLIDGLDSDAPTWKRFASGLHEPLSVAIRDNEIYVFDRNGIWRLRDTDNDGEADRHEMFCNRFAQTAETREFANSMRLAPDGSFIIAKPGQTGSTVGPDSGKILRVSADGKSVTTLAHGFRQPYLGVHPKTGLITVTDQQGNYVPTTPIHVIRGNRYHGFRPTILPHETTPPEIAQPLVWIPHAINASAMNMLWLSDKGMGPLNNTLIHAAYYRSEIFSILWDGQSPNAAVVSITRDFDFTPLSAAVHPKTGHVYVAGFQIWGGSSPKRQGLARLSYLGGQTALPLAATPFREGILLRFDQPIDPATVRPENFSAERWNYKRTPAYGSPHFTPDGAKGQETLFASAAYLSRDGKSVFVAIPYMLPVMQMRIGWSLASTSKQTLQHNAYLTPRELDNFAPASRNFDIEKINLTPVVRQAAENAAPPTAEEGRRLAELMGCVACHSNDGTTLGKVGPTWKGLAGQLRPLANGEKILADADYLRESILHPTAKIAKDFDKSDTGMPSYEGVLTGPQIESLILHIQSLR